jgi:hypothetical protein
MKKYTFPSTQSRWRTTLLLAAAAVVLTDSIAAKPPQSEPGSGFLCRADFLDADVTSTAFHRVVSDGPKTACSPTPNDHPLGATWDYWSSHADHGSDQACPGTGGGQNDVQSNGGRWIFSTGFTERWIRVNWKGALLSTGQADPRISDPAQPDLDSVIYAPDKGPAEKDPDKSVDHLSVRIATDNLFAPGVTRHSLTIEIFEILQSGTGRTWSITYKQPLYVDQDDPANPKVVCLTTVSPSGNSADDVHQAELRHLVKPGRAITIGTYKLPLTILVRQTDTPVQ